MYNVLIRPLHIEDAKISYQWRNDPEVWKYTGSKPNIEVTQEIETDWIKKVIAETSSRRFAILCDGKYIGNVQLTNITDIDAEFHIFIGDKNYWNKGIASLATYEILYFAKNNLNLEHINLSVKSDNVSAVRSYTKNNFVLAENQDNEGWLKMICNLKDLKSSKVSIFIMVYNHAAYLKECLDGILMQKCNFDFEIVVGEDFSTDKSREILIDYSNNFPGKFKLLLHEINIGAVKNQNITFTNCKGNYIAICEGDDYWTDPLKLQKQVDFLEQNNDYVICFHKVDILQANGSVVQDYITKIPENYQERTTLANNSNYIHTPSVVFRNVIQDDINSVEFQKSPIGDYFLYLLVSKYGKIGFINDTMAVYRHGVGVYSSLASLKKHSQELLLFVNLYSAEKDIVIKETFYNNILGYVKHLEKLVEKNEHSSSILKTRRHIFIEKLYRLFK